MRYENLVIDPPWPKKKGGLRKVRPNQQRSLDYQVLDLHEIQCLLDFEILPMGADTHNVWLWAIDQFLHDAEKMMLDRGYRLHARMVWDKGNGVAPAFTVRFAHEYLLWFYRPKLLPVEARGKFLTVIREPARQHSRKPDSAYAMIREMYPDSRCIDVFSRERRDGWDQWGNQTDFFQ